MRQLKGKVKESAREKKERKKEFMENKVTWRWHSMIKYLPSKKAAGPNSSKITSLTIKFNHFNWLIDILANHDTSLKQYFQRRFMQPLRSSLHIGLESLHGSKLPKKD